MSGRPPGAIFTFYSYKGGVGRTMALANVAALLARRASGRVLAMDFDLDAPGLHRYFPRTVDDDPSRGGVIEFFGDLRETLDARFPDDASYEAAPDARQATLSEVVGALLDSGRYITRARVRPYDGGESEILIMKAARFDGGYIERIRGFDWDGFYGLYAEVFPVLTEALRRRYDAVFVDSRTGVSDLWSVCTVLLPDVLVPVCTCNEQSLGGAVEMTRESLSLRHLARPEAPLRAVPLLSRVEDAEDDLKRHWIHEAQTRFETVLREMDPGRAWDLTTHFQEVRIPYRTRYAYGEDLAVERQSVQEKFELAAAYDQLLRVLVEGSATVVPSLSTPTPRVEEPPPSSGAREGILLVAIGSESIRDAVLPQLATLGIEGASVLLDLADPPLIDPDDVDGWANRARQLRNRVRACVETPGIECLHLFYRGPVVAAALVGALVVPSKQLNLYHYENGRYTRLMSLDRRFVREKK